MIHSANCTGRNTTIALIGQKCPSGILSLVGTEGCLLSSRLYSRSLTRRNGGGCESSGLRAKEKQKGGYEG